MSSPIILHGGEHYQMEVQLRRAATLHWTVDASRAVDVYVLDEDNFDAFNDDSEFEYYGDRNRKSHDSNARLNRGVYYFVIDNPSDEDIAVSWEIY